MLEKNNNEEENNNKEQNEDEDHNEDEDINEDEDLLEIPGVHDRNYGLVSQLLPANIKCVHSTNNDDDA